MKNTQALLLLATLFFSVTVRAQPEVVVSSIADLMTDSVVAQDILKEAYSRMGYKMIYDPQPAARALHRAEKGITDGAASRVKKMMLKYPSLIIVPVKLFEFRVSIFTKDKDMEASLDSLRDSRIGIRRGIKIVEAQTADMDTWSSTYTPELFEMLESDRLDALYIAKVDGVVTLTELRNKDKYRFNEIVDLSPALINIPVYHFVHKKNKHLVEKLTKILGQMRDEGYLKKAYMDFEASLRH